MAKSEEEDVVGTYFKPIRASKLMAQAQETQRVGSNSKCKQNFHILVSFNFDEYNYYHLLCLIYYVISMAFCYKAKFIKSKGYNKLKNAFTFFWAQVHMKFWVFSKSVLQGHLQYVDNIVPRSSSPHVCFCN